MDATNDIDRVLDSILSGTGLYQPVEAPVCARTEYIPSELTLDGVARTFICDKPAGHADNPDDKDHRHIYTEPDELVRDGYEPDQAWWVSIHTNSPPRSGKR